MDLAAVKTAVKAWEKAFKAKYSRPPTKDDIKADKNGIAEQYALYRRLSKQAASLPSSSSAVHSSASSSQAGPSRTTPRPIPNSEYPTTPTPPARRRPPPEVTTPSRNDASDRPLKRTASKAELPREPLSPPRRTSLHDFMTPRKTSAVKPGYTGPVFDPNPMNPFSASPSKTPLKTGSGSASFSTNATAGSSRTGGQASRTPNGSWDATSPFIHASTPKKLKEVIAANSLRKVRARLSEADSPAKSKDVTPKTRARMRLAGEAVEPTPGKVAPRRRGQGAVALGSSGETRGTSAIKGKQAMMEEEMDIGSEDEDAFGPSPMKGARGFTALFTEVAEEGAAQEEETAAGKAIVPGMREKVRARDPGTQNGVSAKVKKGKSNRNHTITGFFGMPVRKATKEDIGHSTVPDVRLAQDVDDSPFLIHSHPASPAAPQPDPTDHIAPAPPSPDGARLPTPPPAGDEVDAPDSVPQNAAAGPSRRRKVLALSDDEMDEFDPEAGGPRRVDIVPTRRIVRRRDSWSDLDSGGGDGGDEDGVGVAKSDHRNSVPQSTAAHHDLSPPKTHQPADDDSPAEPTSPASHDVPPHLLSLLSLRSPINRKARSRPNDDLVVRALFDPEAARRLRALRRGQEVEVSGQARTSALVDDGAGEEEGEEEVLRRYEASKGVGMGGTFGMDGASDGGSGREEEVDGRGAGQGGADVEDDDWESESEGWKRTGEDMEDW